MSEPSRTEPSTGRKRVTVDHRGVIGTTVLLALAAWFLLQAVLRVVTASSLGLDEAELLVTTQSLALGYGPQPPLYTWLQFAVFQAFGASILSLALTKELILFGAFALFFAAARFVLGQSVRTVTRSRDISASSRCSPSFLRSDSRGTSANRS